MAVDFYAMDKNERPKHLDNMATTDTWLLFL